MTSPSSPFAVEEYRALRATIRERGSLRLIVVGLTFVAWATFAFAVSVWASVSALTLLPLLVLVTGFEVVFAAHVGVERIGRYVQVRYEGDGTEPPAWEHAAMTVGPAAASGSGIDPLFAPLFVLATLLNLIPVGLLSATEGFSLPGGIPVEVAVYGMLHLLFVWRVFLARRYAARQRSRDLELFKQSV